MPAGNPASLGGRAKGERSKWSTKKRPGAEGKGEG